MITKSQSYYSCQKKVQLGVLWNKVFKKMTFPSFRKHSYWPGLFLSLGSGTAALPEQSRPSAITASLLFHLPALFSECFVQDSLIHVCRVPSTSCSNTGLRAVSSAEAARGAEALQGRDEPWAATSPWHLSASHRITEPDPATTAQETAHYHYALKNFANTSKFVFWSV